MCSALHYGSDTLWAVLQGSIATTNKARKTTSVSQLQNYLAIIMQGNAICIINCLFLGAPAQNHTHNCAAAASEMLSGTAIRSASDRDRSCCQLPAPGFRAKGLCNKHHIQAQHLAIQGLPCQSKHTENARQAGHSRRSRTHPNIFCRVYRDDALALPEFA